nr:RHS repeat-associated core domain-containing protein [Allorhizocola rhizosphaerae]
MLRHHRFGDGAFCLIVPPYGEDRGTQPTGWMGSKGYVGGTKDPSGYVHLSAREYDPSLGRFISVDPIMDLADPQQWNAYTYANSNPTTFSDPSGLRPWDGEDGTKPGSSPQTPSSPKTPPPPAPVTPGQAFEEGFVEATVGTVEAIGELKNALTDMARRDAERLRRGEITWAEAMGNFIKFCFSYCPFNLGATLKGLYAILKDARNIVDLSVDDVTASRSLGRILGLIVMVIVTDGVAASVRTAMTSFRAAAAVEAAAALEAATPTGSKGNPLLTKTPNQPGVINGREYSGHAIDRMQQQGIMPSVVEHAIRGPAIPGKRPGTTAYYDADNHITVITDSATGRVVTVDYGMIRQ